MKILREKLWTLAFCAFCAAVLTLPAWAAGTSGATATTQNAANLPDNDALFYGYLLQRAGASDNAALMDAGSRLGEKDRELYDFLKSHIVKVAAGEETETVFTLVYDDFPTTWTAQDLGVSTCASEEAQAAFGEEIKKLYAYNVDAVMNALLSDCPYELYWYDKTAGYSAVSSDMGYSYSSAAITLTDTPVFYVKMHVWADYGGGTNVNRSLHAGIENTLSNATAIVNAYADKGDYDKLLGYATEICNLVEYHTAAATGNAYEHIGDPWQLINVFDGKPETSKVVCEGYSKAFKFLCDLSQFSSPKVECYLAEGALQAGDASGPHMWNIVTMDNGKNYLVDVTNSDGNGGPEYLFLKGAAPDDEAATQYTFYDWFIFAYDESAVEQWGDDPLTLDTVDYKDAQPSGAVKLGAYALSVSGKAVSMGDLRDGATVDIAADDAAAETNVLLFLVAYNSQGRMTDIQQWPLNLAQSSSFNTQALPESAASVKFILLSESLTPLAPSGTPE